MFKTLAIGLAIYFVWKVAEGFFTGTKKSPKEAQPSSKNQDKEGFTEYEEVE